MSDAGKQLVDRARSLAVALRDAPIEPQALLDAYCAIVGAVGARIASYPPAARSVMAHPFYSGEGRERAQMVTRRLLSQLTEIGDTYTPVATVDYEAARQRAIATTRARIAEREARHLTTDDDEAELASLEGRS